MGEGANILQKQKKTTSYRLQSNQRSRLFLYLGLSYIHLLKQKKGTNAFEKALLLNPCIRLPKSLDLSPLIHQQFAQIRKEYQKACLRQKELKLRKRMFKLHEKVRKRPLPKRSRQISPFLQRLRERRKRRRQRRRQRRLHRKKQSRHVRLAAWLVLGAGTVTFVSALGVGGLSIKDEALMNALPYTKEGTSRYIELHQRVRRRAILANIFLGVSGTLLFTGFALHISQWVRPRNIPQQPIQSNPIPNSVSHSLSLLMKLLFLIK